MLLPSWVASRVGRPALGTGNGGRLACRWERSAPWRWRRFAPEVLTCENYTIRGVLRACPAELAELVRSALERDDDYAAAGRPVCDWDDAAAREQLVDALFRDGYRALGALRGLQLGPEVAQSSELLATVIGQDIQETTDGRFVIAQGVAPDRVISVVDPQARHGHKSNARGFDGYKGHVAIDPDSEVITAAEVGAANAGDAGMAPTLLADLPAPADQGTPGAAPAAADQATATTDRAPVVYGDAAYGTGALLAELDHRGITTMTKVAAPTAPAGHFTKQQFQIDLAQGTVTCPARLTVAIIPARQGGGLARFGCACGVCPLAASCTTSPAGRTITTNPQEARLQTPEAGSATRPGEPTIALTGPPWNANSLTRSPTTSNFALRHRHLLKQQIAGWSPARHLGLGSLLGDDLDAQVDAFVADVDVGTGDQLVDLAPMLAAERARQGGGGLSRAGSAPPEPHCLSLLPGLSLTAGGGRVVVVAGR
jgi:Transposase DDE domain